ncbi:MAG: 16S rRNA (cytosine(1402)-N(4))-methyltransferase RsmH [Chloroflexota bacterium]
MEEGHLPVMVEEVMTALSPRPGSFQVDGTVGGGGHALRILEATSPDGRLLGLDADPRAIARVERRLAGFGDRVLLRNTNFEHLDSVAHDVGWDQVDGILLDLGLSSFQLAEGERGFSFRAEGPLDMRFDPTQGQPASELVNTLDEDALARLFRAYGEEPDARRIARAIVKARAETPIETAAQLAAIVSGAVSRPRHTSRHSRIHPATRVFQALRIAVNAELDVLARALGRAVDLLRPGGVLVVISYHSLEDRIVKRTFAAERRGCICPPEAPVCVCGRQPRLAAVGGTKPQLPSEAEVAANPRARSARLRAAMRLAA